MDYSQAGQIYGSACLEYLQKLRQRGLLNEQLPYEITDLKDGLTISQLLEQYDPQHFDKDQVISVTTSDTKQQATISKHNMEYIVDFLKKAYIQICGRPIDPAYLDIPEIVSGNSAACLRLMEVVMTVIFSNREIEDFQGALQSCSEETQGHIMNMIGNQLSLTYERPADNRVEDRFNDDANEEACKQIEQMEQEIIQLQKQKEALNGELRWKDHEIANSQARIKEAEHEREILRKEQADFLSLCQKTTFQDVWTTLKTKEQEHLLLEENLKDNTFQYYDNVNAKKMQIAELESLIADLKQKIAAAGDIDELKQRNADMQKQLNSNQELLSYYTNNYKNASENYNIVEKKYREIQDAYLAIRAQAQTSQGQCYVLNCRLEELQKTVDDLKLKEESSKKQIESLESSLKNKVVANPVTVETPLAIEYDTMHEKEQHALEIRQLNEKIAEQELKLQARNQEVPVQKETEILLAQIETLTKEKAWLQSQQQSVNLESYQKLESQVLQLQKQLLDMEQSKVQMKLDMERALSEAIQKGQDHLTQQQATYESQVSQQNEQIVTLQKMQKLPNDEKLSTEMKNQIEAKSKQITELLLQVDNLTKEVLLLRTKGIEKEKECFQKLTEELANEQANVKSEFDKAQVESQKALSQHQKQIFKLQKDLIDSNAQCATTNQELQKVKMALNSANDLVRRLEERQKLTLQSLNDEKESAKRNALLRQNLEQELTQKQDILSQMSAQLEKDQQKLKSMNEENNQLLDEKSKDQVQLAEQKFLIQNQTIQISTLQLEKKNLEKDKAALQEQVVRLEAECQRQKSEFQDLRQYNAQAIESLRNQGILQRNKLESFAARLNTIQNALTNKNNDITWSDYTKFLTKVKNFETMVKSLQTRLNKFDGLLQQEQQRNRQRQAKEYENEALLTKSYRDLALQRMRFNAAKTLINQVDVSNKRQGELTINALLTARQHMATATK